MGRWVQGILITAALLSVGGVLGLSWAQGPYTLKLPLGLQEEAAYIPPGNPVDNREDRTRATALL